MTTSPRLEVIADSLTETKELVFHRKGFLKPIRRSVTTEDAYKLIESLRTMSPYPINLDSLEARTKKMGEGKEVKSFPEFFQLFSTSYDFRTTSLDDLNARLSSLAYNIDICTRVKYYDDNIMALEGVTGVISLLMGLTVDYIPGTVGFFIAGGSFLSDLGRRINIEGKTSLEIRMMYKGPNDTNNPHWKAYQDFIAEINSIKSYYSSSVRQNI